MLELLQIHTKPCPGAGVIIAQSWGAHDPEAVDRQVHTALVLSMGLASLLFILYYLRGGWLNRCKAAKGLE